MTTTISIHGAVRQWQPWVRRALPALLIGLLVWGGCASGGKSQHRRGSLSDVAAKAAEEDDDDGDEENARSDGPTRTRTDHETSAATTSGERSSGSSWSFGVLTNNVGDTDSYPADAEPNVQARNGYESPTRYHSTNILLGFTQVFPAGDTIERLSTVSVAISWYAGSRIRWALGGYYGEGRRGSSPLVQSGIRTLQEYGFDLGARAYLAGGHTFVGFYALGGLRFGNLHWKYVQDVDVGGGETISSDKVSLAKPYVGVGCAFVQTNSVQAAVNAVWSLRLPAEETSEGFTNDLFPAIGALGWSLDFAVFF